MEFADGNVVQLKSGSPSMTVIKVYKDEWGDPLVKCQWFCESTGEFKVGDFYQIAVKHI